MDFGQLIQQITVLAGVSSPRSELFSRSIPGLANIHFMYEVREMFAALIHSKLTLLVLIISIIIEFGASRTTQLLPLGAEGGRN